MTAAAAESFKNLFRNRWLGRTDAPTWIFLFTIVLMVILV